MIRLLAMLTLTVSLGYASNPSAVELVATYDLSQLPAGSVNLICGVAGFCLGNINCHWPLPQRADRLCAVTPAERWK